MLSQERIKFKTERVGAIPEDLLNSPAFIALAGKVSDAIVELEALGATPVMYDGLVGGNAAFILTKDQLPDTQRQHAPLLVVTKSGKAPNRRPSIADGDFVVAVGFDRTQWKVDYWSVCGEKPTSDTPLHYAALMPREGRQQPQVAIHGHMFSTEEDAQLNGLPISKELTLFSTPEDLHALQELMDAFPYPDYRVYIRKGHGFFSVGDTVEMAMENVRCLKQAKSTAGKSDAA